MARHLGLRIGRHWTLALLCDRDRGGAYALPPSLTRAVTVGRGLQHVLARDAIRNASLDAAVIEVTEQLQLVPGENGGRVVPWVHGAEPGFASGVPWSQINDMGLEPDVLASVAEGALSALVARLEELTGACAVPWDSLTVVLAEEASTEVALALRAAASRLAPTVLETGFVHEPVACAGLALATGDAGRALDAGAAVLVEVAAPQGPQHVLLRRHDQDLRAQLGAEEAPGETASPSATSHPAALHLAVHEAALDRKAQALGACLLGRVRHAGRLAFEEAVPLQFQLASAAPGPLALPLERCRWRRHLRPPRRLSWLGIRPSDELRGPLPLKLLACLQGWRSLRPLARLMLLREDVVQREDRRFLVTVDAPFGAGGTVIRVSDDQGRDLARALVPSLDARGTQAPDAGATAPRAKADPAAAFQPLPLAEPHPWKQADPGACPLATEDAACVVPAGWTQALATGVYHAVGRGAGRLEVASTPSVRHRWMAVAAAGCAAARELHIGPFVGLSDTDVGWEVRSRPARGRVAEPRPPLTGRIRVERPYYGLRAELAWSGDTYSVASPLATAADGTGVPAIAATGMLVGGSAGTNYSLSASGKLSLQNTGGETLRVELLAAPGLRLHVRTLLLEPSSRTVVPVERRRGTDARAVGERTALELSCRSEPLRAGRAVGPAVLLEVPLQLETTDAACQVLPPRERVSWKLHTWAPPGAWSLRMTGTGPAPTRANVRLGRPAEPLDLEARVSALERRDGTWKGVIVLLAQPLAVVRKLRAPLSEVRGRLLVAVGDERRLCAEVEVLFTLALRGAVSVRRRLRLAARTGDTLELPFDVLETPDGPRTVQAVAEVTGEVALRLDARLTAGSPAPPDGSAGLDERLEAGVLDANAAGARAARLTLTQGGVFGFEGGVSSGVLRLVDVAAGTILDEIPLELSLAPLEPTCEVTVDRMTVPTRLLIRGVIGNSGNFQRIGLRRLEVRLRLRLPGLSLGPEVVGARHAFEEPRLLRGGQQLPFSKELPARTFGPWGPVVRLATAVDVAIVVQAASEPALGGGATWTISRRLPLRTAKAQVVRRVD